MNRGVLIGILLPMEQLFCRNATLSPVGRHLNVQLASELQFRPPFSPSAAPFGLQTWFSALGGTMWSLDWSSRPSVYQPQKSDRPNRIGHL